MRSTINLKNVEKEWRKSNRFDGVRFEVNWFVSFQCSTKVFPTQMTPEGN